jgi:hypothetical protein
MAYPSLFRSRIVAVIMICGGALSAARADGSDGVPAFFQPAAEVRSGGVLEESYAYHRQSMTWPNGEAPSPLPHSTQLMVGTPGGRGGRVVPAGGWYGYGFPVRTFRWGWFGARHYYPTVWWHEGYYGDCCRHAYRRGY